MKYNQLLTVLKLLIFVSFFLPFFYGCDREESIRYTRQKAREKMMHDSAAKAGRALETGKSDESESPINPDSTLLRKFWRQITLPDYGRGFALTGFAYFIFAVKDLVKIKSSWTGYILPVLLICWFISVVWQLFVSGSQRKILLWLAAFNAALFILFLFYKDINEHLYGYWMGLIISIIYLFILVKKNWKGWLPEG